MALRWSIAILVTAACGGDSSGDDDDARETVVEVPATPNRELDLLFMVDDSGSMADKQANLAANIPNLIAQLGAAPDGLPSLHLGIVSSDMGTLGTARTIPGPAVGVLGQGGCAGSGRGGSLTVNGAAVAGNFLEDLRNSDGSRETNYSGNLADVFGDMATLGAAGCGFEQPLHAIKAALDNNVNNAGFLRPDALLAVIMLTDEDDCSMKDPELLSSSTTLLGPQQSFRCTRFGVTCAQGGATPTAMNQVGAKSDCTASTSSDLLDDVESYRDFLVGLKADPKQVVVGAIMAPPEPVAVELRSVAGQPATAALAHSCTFDGTNGPEVGDPGIRIQSFLDLFPNRSASSTICQQDLSGGIDLIADLVAQSIGSPCVTRRLADSDEDKRGLQVDCLVEDVLRANALQIAPCDADEDPTCWKLEEDLAMCPSAQHLKLVVVRARAPDPDTVTRMRCVVR